MNNEKEFDFTELKTVSSFDNGDNSNNKNSGAMAVDVGVSSNSGKQQLKRFSPSSILVESLIEQLCKMVEKDPSDRKSLYLNVCSKLHQLKLVDTSYHRDEFDTMRTNYQIALYNLLAVAKTNHHLSKVNTSSHQTSPPSLTAIFPKLSSGNFDLELSSPSCILDWSRYANEFVELEFIARGGFGQVYKARHKLDENVYAVKKIHLRYRNADGFLRSLKEVKMLACLNHPNIVAYKAAWLEPFDNRSAFISQGLGDHRFAANIIVDDYNTESQHETEDSTSNNIVFEKSISKSTSEDVKLLNNRSRNEEGEEVVVNQRVLYNKCDGTAAGTTGITITSSSGGGSSSFGYVDGTAARGAAVCKYRDNFDQITCASWNFMKDWATLYIQMQLCDKNMREWLDMRNRSALLKSYEINGTHIKIEECLTMLIKVLKGIEYIHNKGIVHHDIKPSNIFISEDLSQVQVGDFGLACCLLTHKTTTVPLVRHRSQHDGQIGTKLYAAPEQMKGDCSPKSDIYSVGIIILELIRPFQTEMERSKVIAQLKRGHIPVELLDRWPGLVKIIKQTMSASPNLRPTASQLLKSVTNYMENPISNQSCGLLTANDAVIYEKDKIIFKLRAELATKEQEIFRLKQQLAQFKLEKHKSIDDKNHCLL